MNRSKYGRPETTRVLWRRTSATRIAYGSRVRRNARSLRCASYQGRRRSARPVPIPREPLPRGLRRGERLEGLLQGPPARRAEPLPRGDEVGGLVVVEPDAGPEERRDRGSVPLKEEAVLRESTHGRVRRAGFRLNC